MINKIEQYELLLKELEKKYQLGIRSFGIDVDTDFLIYFFNSNSPLLKSKDLSFKQFITEEASQNVDIMKKACFYNGLTLEFASEHIKNNINIVSIAIKENGKALKYASDELKNNKELIIFSLEENIINFEYASEILKDNREFIIEVLNRDIPKKGLILLNSSKKLQNDEALVLKCIATNHAGSVFASSFGFASEQLRKDRNFVIKAVSTNGNCLIQTGEFKKDLEIQRIAITKSPEVYHLADDELKEDKELLKDVLSKKGIMLQHALKKYQNDKEIVLIALQSDKKAKFFIGEELKKEIGDLNPIEYIMSELLFEKIEKEILKKEYKVKNKKKCKL